jgi:hypothetical protein
MDTVVISLGGSVLVPGDSDAEYIKTLSTVLKKNFLKAFHSLLSVEAEGLHGTTSTPEGLWVY